jgi:AbrB family looped-hinge helix DNA binding protein
VAYWYSFQVEYKCTIRDAGIDKKQSNCYIYQSYHINHTSMFEKQFYGSTTVGERGQVVIPVEARKELGMEPGEKLLVLGVHGKAIVLTKLSSFQKMSSEMKKRQEEIEEMLRKA